MSSNPTLAHALESSIFQIEKCYEGMTPATASAKLTEGGMTPIDTLAHLSDCCLAFLATADGKEYEWGSYQSAHSDFDGRLAEFRGLRSQAAARALGDDKLANEALGFLALHEAYHVGQLAALRLKHEPEWNSYSIYGM